MRRRVSEKNESEKALEELSVEEVVGELGSEMTKIKELLNKKITRLDDDVLER